MYVTIGQASEIIGVSISTLRRWECEGKYTADYRTKGNHRRYCINRLKKEILEINNVESIWNSLTIIHESSSLSSGVYSNTNLSGKLVS